MMCEASQFAQHSSENFPAATSSCRTTELQSVQFPVGFIVAWKLMQIVHTFPNEKAEETGKCPGLLYLPTATEIVDGELRVTFGKG